jgi:hypothetical protein
MIDNTVCLPLPLFNIEHFYACNPGVANPTIQGGTWRPGGIREINGDFRFLGEPQNFPQRLVHFQAPIVIYESLLSESIHEQIDSWARGANHFR